MKLSYAREYLYNHRHRVVLFFAFFAVFLGGMFAGYHVARAALSADDDTSRILHSFATDTQLTNPILDCELYPGKEHRTLKRMELALDAAITELRSEKKIREGSVYVRDLVNGGWIGVNERTTFSPASLLKVPIMMAVYKVAERDRSFLEKQIAYRGDMSDEIGLTQNISPTEPLKQGDVYSIETLVRHMIVFSDNNAMQLIIENLAENDLIQVYRELGIDIPGMRAPEDYMTVKEYATFFRILYNATYLTREYSERALRILTEVEFAEGIKSALPPDTQLAHKFGERGLPNPAGGEIRQLHDCGVVYHPSRPFIACVMTRGDDFPTLASSIARISSIVYAEIERIEASVSVP